MSPSPCRPAASLGVVGESGCGKSTLARLILGLLEPSAGDIAVEGQRVVDMDRRARARLIQPVFQDPFASLNPLARVRDIVAMPLAAQGDILRPRRDRQARRRDAGPRRPHRRDGPAAADRAVGRPAPAGRHRPRPGAAAAHRRLRRADLGARRLGAGADPEPAGRAAPRARPHLSVHQPQPRRGRACRERGGGDVSRPHRRARRRPRRCSARPSIPTPRRCSPRC